VTSLAVSPSSTHVTIFYSSLTLRLYELLPSGNSLPAPSSSDSARSSKNIIQPVRTISKCHDAPVHVCRIDPSSTLLASGSADGVVKVWDVQRGYATHMFKGHGGVVSALAFNYPHETSSLPSSTTDPRMQLITASADTRIRIFDLTASSSRSAGAKAQDVLEGHVSVPRGLDVTADGRWLVSGGRDAVAMIWDLNGDEMSSRSKGKGKAVPENRSKPRLVKTIPVLERIEAVGVIVASEVVASTPSEHTTAGRLRFYTGGEKGVIRIWDATEAEVIATLGNDISEGTEDLAEDPRGILDVMYALRFLRGQPLVN
jgi:U3 small nucleolar RNA-associated protein 13